jgi:pimeloyl-ACP methyl ester carboxylesterase
MRRTGSTNSLIGKTRDQLDPLRRQQADVDGRTVRWYAGGPGPPLVCVHGLAGSWRWWTRIVPPLAERFEVHLVDVPRFSRLARFRPGDAAA